MSGVRVQLPFADRWTPEFQRQLNESLEERFRRLNEYALVPYGGTSGQALVKASDKPYELSWGDMAGGSGIPAISDEILADVPLAYWKLDGATYLDSSGNAYDAIASTNVSQTPLLPYETNRDGTRIVGPGGYVQFPDASVGSVPVTGDWTVTACVRPLDYSLDACRIFSATGSGETEAVNYQVYVALTAQTGELQAFWETGAGTNVRVMSGVFLRIDVPYHIAVVKRAAADVVDFYVDGLLMSTVVYNGAQEPTGGTSIDVRAGNDGSGDTGTFVMGHLAFWRSALSATRIRAHAAAAAMDGVGERVEIGFKDIPLSRTTSAATTLTQNDRGKHVTMNGGTTRVVTVPADSADSFPIGSTVSIVNLGSVNMTISSSDTLILGGTAVTGSRTLAPNGIATLLKVMVTTWIVSGPGVT